MGDVLVRGGRIADGRLTELMVDLHGLSSRTIDRDTALRWMKDGHSLIPIIDGARGPALQLVEVADDHVIRHDNAAEPSDSLPKL